MVFQRNLEKRAYELGKGKIPQQLFADFKVGKVSEGYGSFGSCQKGQTAFANLRTLLPETLNEAFCEGMHAFSEKIHGFDREDAILSGVESRTSSSVRIFRESIWKVPYPGFILVAKELDTPVGLLPQQWMV